MLELIADSAKLGLIISFVYFALHLYAKRSGAAWTAVVLQRRVAVLLVLALAATAIKIVEDVLGRESGPFDDALLEFVRGHVPGTLTGFFATVTATGSFPFLFPIATLASLVLVLAKRYSDALFVALSLVVASVLVFLIKVG